MPKIEHTERYSWWLNGLDSLGISTLEKDKDGLKNHKEASNLTEAVNKHFMKITFKPIVKVTNSETGSDKFT